MATIRMVRGGRPLCLFGFWADESAGRCSPRIAADTGCAPNVDRREMAYESSRIPLDEPDVIESELVEEVASTRPARACPLPNESLPS